MWMISYHMPYTDTVMTIATHVDFVKRDNGWSDNEQKL